MFPQRSTPRALTAALALVAALMVTPAQAATITVTTVDDANPPATNGQCSLREALINASNDAATYADCPAGTGDDVITFSYGLFTAANQYTATINLVGRLVAGTATGTAHALEIRPPGSINLPRVRLAASTVSPHAVMDVLPTAKPFVLERTNIEGGRGLGGGGGIRLMSDDATFESVHFIDNQADSGGALGQLYGNGNLRISNGLFQDNHAADGRGGAIELGSINPAHQVSIFNTSFIGNQAGSDGGAILFEVAEGFSGMGTPLLDIAYSRFVDNSSGRNGGGLFAAAGFNVNQRMQVQISDSLFRGNQANSGLGGGVRVEGFSASQAGQTRVHIQRSSFIDNRAADGGGGGLVGSNLDMHVENSLFAENHALVSGAGLIHGASDVDSPPRTLTLIGNSFHRQTQTYSVPGRSLYLLLPPDASGWTLMFSGNLFDPASNSSGSDECMIGFIEGGSTQPPTLQGGDNLSPEASCLFLGTADIQAAPLMTATSNSGNLLKPLLLLPQPGSPAIDAWRAEACKDRFNQPLTLDLRDATRPADGDGSGIADCDIGAFELPALPGTDFIFANGFE